jgi:hypothetical protein
MNRIDRTSSSAGKRDLFLWAVWLAAWPLATDIATASSAGEARMTAERAVAFLEQRASEVIRDCRMTADDGAAIYVPDSGKHYRAFWVRDFCYMVEGAPEALPPDELERGYLWLIARQRKDGAMPDRVETDGSATFTPGPRHAPLCAEPVTDGPQFMVKIAQVVVQRTGRLDAFLQTADALEAGLRYLPRKPETGLVHIAMEDSRCPYGFTDTVRKKGDVLFSSILYVEACRILADLFGRADEPERAGRWKVQAERVQAGLETLWDEQSGYYLAASRVCRQPDVWGTAYAVYQGVTDGQRQQRISTQMLADADRILRAGQVRHLPAPLLWEDCRAAPGTYQNGGYWATATGWVYWTIRLTDREAADRILVDLAEDFQRRGYVPEWTTPQTSDLTGYAASVATPLHALRRVSHTQVGPSQADP